MHISTLNCLVLSCLVAAPAQSGELVVIVSARSSVATLRADQVADIFLGQAGRFPDGLEAVALDQSLGSPIRNDFYSKVAAKSPSLLKAHWSKMIFTGRGQPPKEVSDSIAILKLVASNPGLIGYIDKAVLDPSVKTVLVVR